MMRNTLGVCLMLLKNDIFTGNGPGVLSRISINN
jgi:hypothetical protein